MRKGWGCFAFLLLSAFAAFAQSDRGTITGTVADPGGAVIAGAAVEAKNVATGAVYPAATSATGNYTIPIASRRLRAGRHCDGFQKVYPHRSGGGGGGNAARRRHARSRR